MKKKRKKTSPARSSAQRWSDLSWTDLNDWAGSRAVTRGRSYQRRGLVEDLGISRGGELVAWVTGRERYATRVRRDLAGPGNRAPMHLESSCSCPVGIRCKHAVAVILAALEALGAGEKIRQVSSRDLRWDLATGVSESATSDTPSNPSSLKPYLFSFKKSELVEFLLELSAAYPEVKADIVDRSIRASGDVAAVVQQIRREIDAVSKQPVWWDHWRGEGELPDYSRVEKGLASLLGSAHYDEICELGRELFEAGRAQLEGARDDGQTCMAISDCMSIVFRAVLKSSLSDPEKILWAIDLSMEDDFGLAEEIGSILERRWSKRTWSAVADGLAVRLDSLGDSEGGDFAARFERECLCRWLCSALDAAGRGEEAIETCEGEALTTGNYEPLVRRLMDAGRLDEAVQWAERGYAAVLGEMPGVAEGLRTLLREIAHRRRQWPLVAAYDAECFLERPNVSNLKKLLAAAKKAHCEGQVREAALRFLETGRDPARSKKWPLPPTRLATGASSQKAGELVKHWDVLRDLAIDEDRPDDVLRWHDRLAQRTRSRFWYSQVPNLRVAEAVAATHPERAIEIYRRAAERLIGKTNPDSYVEAGALLERVRDLLHASGHADEWPAILAELRQVHSRKWRLMEVLDGLEGKPIVPVRKVKGSQRRRRSRT